jgi:hypothetical protein
MHEGSMSTLAHVSIVNHAGVTSQGFVDFLMDEFNQYFPELNVLEERNEEGGFRNLDVKESIHEPRRAALISYIPSYHSHMWRAMFPFFFNSSTLCVGGAAQAASP